MSSQTYAVLDRIRETQHIHTASLNEIIGNQKVLIRLLKAKSGKESTDSMNWKGLLKVVASSFGQWAGGLLAMAYAAKGGDLITALEKLVKLLQSI